eukprot:scaffold109714_cov17-Tisochrysis_lutea.AAC.1
MGESEGTDAPPSRPAFSGAGGDAQYEALLTPDMSESGIPHLDACGADALLCFSKDALVGRYSYVTFPFPIPCHAGPKPQANALLSNNKLRCMPKPGPDYLRGQP